MKAEVTVLFQELQIEKIIDTLIFIFPSSLWQYIVDVLAHEVAYRILINVTKTKFFQAEQLLTADTELKPQSR